MFDKIVMMLLLIKLLLVFTIDLKKVNDTWEFPTKDDLSGAALGLERLQRVYKLNTSDLANGIIRNTKFKYVIPLFFVSTIISKK